MKASVSVTLNQENIDFLRLVSSKNISAGLDKIIREYKKFYISQQMQKEAEMDNEGEGGDFSDYLFFIQDEEKSI